MGTKNNPGQFDCYDKALPDEPIFVLLARDSDAPRIIRLWAEMRESRIKVGLYPKDDQMMVAEAHKCAADMDRWRAKNDGKWRQASATAEPVWQWYWGHGREPERYYGGFPSREEALADAQENAEAGIITICEAAHMTLRDNIFTAFDVLDTFSGCNADAADEDGDLQMDPTPTQEQELEAALNATFAAWRARHNLGRAWSFAETRNDEVVDLSVPAENVE